MKFVTRWSLKNRAIVDVISIVLILGSLYATLTIRREMFPSFSFDLVTVTTVMPGATPEDMERLVTAPLEDEIVDLAGVDHVVSTSADGRSVIAVFVDPDNATVAEVLRDVERAVELVPDLPEEAEDPIVRELKAEDNVLTAALIGEAPWDVRKRITDQLKEKMRSIPGVSTVVVAGVRDLELEVAVDPERLSARGLTASDVVAAIRGADADLPAGVLATREGELLVRTVGRIETPENLGAIVVRKTPAGLVRIRDVAEVRYAFEDERTRSRVAGAPAAILSVLKARDGDVLKIAERLKTLLKEEAPSLPEGLRFEYVQDGSVWVQERLDVAVNSGLWGFVLVFLLLAVFLDIGAALWCAWGIPFSVIGGILVLYMTGGTLNMLTLFGFILVIGMLVDDAIVVVENVTRYRESGLPPGKAVYVGASEVARPIVAAVLTTIAALLPMALMSGIMGKFMAEIPKPGMYALAVSLLEALVILPAHLYVTSAWERPGFLEWPMAKWDIVRGWGDGFIAFCRAVHQWTLRRFLRHRLLFLAGILVLFVGSLVVAAVGLRFEFVSTHDMPMFMVEIETPSGTSLDELEDIVATVEREIAKISPDELKSFSSTIGMRLDEHNGPETRKEVAQIMVELREPEVRERNADVIMADLRPRVAGIGGADITVVMMSGGPPVGDPVNVRISGSDWASLRRLADEMKEFAGTLPGVTDIEDDMKLGKREIVVNPRADASAMAGVTPLMLAAEVRAAVDGIEAASVRIGNEDVKVRVRYPEDRRRHSASVRDIRLAVPGTSAGGSPAPSGAAPLSNLAEINSDRGLSDIHHYEGKRTVTVTAQIAAGGIESREANRLIHEKFSDEAKRRGMAIALGGEEEDTAKSMESVKGATLIGISLIAIILVFEFGNFWQPIAILSALPLAVIGVVLTLVVHSAIYAATGLGFDTPMGLLPAIGLLALLGVIVNDSIILIDFINTAREAGASRWRSILKAGATRIRPVILTSVTTAAGILPMAYTLRGSSSFLAPMALAFGWGLLFGTALTLFVVPVFMAVMDDIRMKLFGSYFHSEEEENGAAIEK